VFRLVPLSSGGTLEKIMTASIIVASRSIRLFNLNEADERAKLTVVITDPNL
jgi:hypothetical protein